LLFTQVSYPQRSYPFYDHEIKISFGDPLNTNQSWQTDYVGSLSVSYSYCHLKWLWFGINAVNYIGTAKHYNLREYVVDFILEKISILLLEANLE
jgi:hypothetical protein